jgi:hypothetical protein
MLMQLTNPSLARLEVSLSVFAKGIENRTDHRSNG